MNNLDEQAERHAATMDFLKSGKELADEIAAELKRIDDEEREQLEESYQGRMVKAEVIDE